MKINLKREEDLLKSAKMERLNLRRKEWEIRSICNNIVRELVEELEIFEIKSWMSEIDALVDALEMDSERFAKSEKVMEVEEEWLTGVAINMMEYNVFTAVKETRRLGEDYDEIDMNTNIYLELDYMEWLETELRHLKIDAKTIAKVLEEVEVMVESVVGLESKHVYLNHHGRVHTPLPGPAIITEKGVELGQVIGLYFTDGKNDRRTDSIELDWSGVGGVEKAIPGVEDVIKYVSEVVEMPRWTPMNYKPSCSKWCDPSDRIYGKYEIYDPYMGKGDVKKRWEKERTEWKYSGSYDRQNG